MAITQKLTRLEKLRNRRIDPQIKVGELNEAYARLKGEDSAVQYAIGAMQPIDAEYTKRTLEERSRVEQHLRDGFLAASREVEFDYQGSVTNDTHIRAHSDVDLLTVDGRWFTMEPPNRPTFIYQGDPVQDLKELRTLAARKLKSAFPTATVDESGGKAVNISGGSLRRKVDVIACGWWRTVEYVREGHKHWIGVQVLDNDANARISNKPFLHNKRIEDRDATMNGGLRKVIRLMKSLKYDSDETIVLSSYDIAAIAYNIYDEWLISRPGQDLVLVKNCHAYHRHLIDNPEYRATLDVPNKMRKVFCAEGATEAGLRQMELALRLLVQEIEQGLTRSFKKLAEARIPY